MTRTPGPRLDARGIDRAAGVLLGAAVGDALGVPYGFKATLREDQQPGMIGGGLGPYRPGEYSDDTQMQVCVAQVAATGADLRGPEALDAIAAGFRHWMDGGASDVGAQTRSVLGAAERLPGSPAEALREAARRYAAGHRLTAGNGSLTRTGIVALAHLADAAAPDGAAVAAVTGALLGAAHGVRALPAGPLSRHELAWVLDTLAHDLIAPTTAGSTPTSGR
ncbi:ADP-ribosylglycohydrolase family protein [Streptomyces sp. NPDC059718]